jgi:D-psicose/D-tagatose/L-ribulose 3-epimerase
MVQFGAHAFVWVGSWTTESGNRAIDSAAASGFDFIEIPLLDPEAFDAAAHRRVLRDAGLGVTASVVLPEDAHMPEHPDRATAFLLAAMDQLEAVGGTYLCGCIAYHLGRMTGEPPTAEERQVVAETLGPVAEEARRRGITLGFEVCNRYETYLYNTLADGRDAIRQIGADNIELHADTYHMNIEEEGFHAPLVDVADVLGYIHMSESHRGLVGSGTIDWPEVFRGLVDARYTGPLVLESFAAINPALAAATRLWRAPRHSSDVIATEGLAFLRERAAEAGLGTDGP